MNAEIKILVVDDVQNNLTAMEALLGREGLTILKANSGTQALEILLEHEVALALVDVQMPGMDGFELAELVRGTERTRSIPLIFLTAASRDPGRTFRGYEAGAVDFLYKPVDPQILRSKVQVFIALYEQRKQLASQLEELRHALHLNDIFTAVLGHDLRNPLSGISFSTELILQLSRDEKVLAAASRIKSSSQRMSRMIVQLLDVARIRTTGLELHPQAADMMAVCTAIRDELPQADAPQRVQIELTGNPQGSFDADRMSQVISNLLSNAIQHGTPGDAIHMQIDGDDPCCISVAVRNSGSIPEEHRASVFQAFQRCGAAGQREGLGLGLYIVERFVHCHGGTVKLDCDEHSTTVRLTIPRHHQPAQCPAEALSLNV